MRRPEEYEKIQIATNGRLSILPTQLTWKERVLALIGWLVLSLIVALITYYNLTLLYRFNPDYGADYTAARAF